MAQKALFQQWNKALSFDKVIKWLGVEVVDSPEKADHDFSLKQIGKKIASRSCLIKIYSWFFNSEVFNKGPSLISGSGRCWEGA